jgi:acyl-CoA reductase-like NAD-dependent aldehyde dehydrogenase
LEEGNFTGPLHFAEMVKEYLDVVAEVKKEGGKVIVGGERIEGKGNYVMPTIVEIGKDKDVVN